MIIMSRIDERLLHGQVVLAWLKAYPVQEAIVVDDDSAHDSLKKMLLEMAVSGQVKVTVVDEEEAPEAIKAAENKNVFLVAADPVVFLHLLEKGIDIPNVNIGGIYDKPDRKQLYTTVFVNDQIKQTILDISKYTKVEHRVVPNDNSVDIISDLSK